MNSILKYFPNLSSEQTARFRALDGLYKEWNEKVNLISRKDIDKLYEHHVLHSLAIAKVITFKPGTKVMDLGTGGGFPGIPLAIFFPEVQFILVDSITKKYLAVKGIIGSLGLHNTDAVHGRAEELNMQVDFVTVRAVAPIDTLLYWSKGRFLKKNRNTLANGLLCLKGGDLKEELKGIRNHTIYNLDELFEEEYFKSKVLVHVPYPNFKP